MIQDLKKMRTTQVREHEVQALRGALNEMLGETAEKLQAAQVDDAAPQTLAPGDNVMLVNLNTRATVLTAPDAKGEVTVQAGAMKMKVKLQDTRLAQPEAKPKPRKTGSFTAASVPRGQESRPKATLFSWAPRLS